MELLASITQIKSRMAASGDKVTTLTLEVHGPIDGLHNLMEKPLAVKLEVEENRIS